MLNSGGAFSPIAYPWIFPLLLSPFVKWWGLDYDRLKLVEVACFCVWIVLVHGIVRRRAGRVLAIAIAAVVATAPALLAHTDQLLSEFPHAMALGVFIWWFDRIKLRHDLDRRHDEPARHARRARGGRLQRASRERRADRRASCVVQLVELFQRWRADRFAPRAVAHASPRRTWR